ncbi:MAG: WG repeat-containing protein [Patescibacteria group bacterium]
MLKEAKYRCWGYPIEGFPEFHRIAYVIVGNRCYFSGLERGTSTINAAEDVIVSIAKQEGVNFFDLRYFDIQTHKGYRKFPGEYKVNELKYEICREATEQERIEEIEERFGCKVIQSYGTGPRTVEECKIVPSVTVWVKAFLPADILELFKEHIGIDLKTIYKEVWKETEGLIVVRDEEDKYLFVYLDGTPVFPGRYNDLTPFKNGLAWVANEEWMWVQIDKQGNFKSEFMTHTDFLNKFF